MMSSPLSLQAASSASVQGALDSASGPALSDHSALSIMSDVELRLGRSGEGIAMETSERAGSRSLGDLSNIDRGPLSWREKRGREGGERGPCRHCLPSGY